MKKGILKEKKYIYHRQSIEWDFAFINPPFNYNLLRIILGSLQIILEKKSYSYIKCVVNLNIEKL